MPAQRCAVVIPARDEAGSIGQVVRQGRATLDAEIIVVDNNSRDETAKVAAAAGAQVVRESARGYGHACLRGVRAATDPDVIVFIDGDGSMPPEDIPSLIAPIASGVADIVCGSRRSRAQADSMPAHQAFGNWLAVTLLRLLYGVRLTDLGPFRAIRASTLRSLEVPPSRFAFLADLLARAALDGARIVEVDVGYRPRTAGRSKVGGSLRGSVEAGAEILGTLLWNRGRLKGLPWMVGAAASTAFFLLSWLRYASFHSTAYDLGFFDQVVWNAAHGHGLSTSFLAYSFFGQHFEPALLIFVPLYALASTPLWLLLGQSLALGLAAVPLFSLVARWIDRRAAWIVVAAYLMQLAVSRTVAFDFHTEALAVPFVFIALHAASAGHRRRFLAAALVPLLCKEDGALVGLALGLFVFVLLRERWALLVSLVSVAWGGAVLLVIMPALRHGLQGDLISRYQYLGASPGVVLVHLVTRPATVVGHVAQSGSILALLLALIGLGFLPLRRPGLLLIAFTPIAPALLSSDPGQARMDFHYGIPGVPLLLAAATLGWQRLAANHGQRTIGGMALLGGAAAIFFLLSPLPRVLTSDLPDLARSPAVDALLRRIPASASVAASTSLVPHLSERAVIDELPCGIGNDVVVAVDERRPPSGQSRAAGAEQGTARLRALGYRVSAETAGVSVWSLDGSDRQPPATCFP